jgi:putative CRISPR-associated protein (TIGR02619 family)
VTKRLIVSTCGTSSLTNGAPKPMQDSLRLTANDSERELHERPEGAAVVARVAEAKARLAGASADGAAKQSAELAGLLKLGFSKGDHHVLLHSATFQGKAAAEGLLDWLLAQNAGLSGEVRQLNALTTRSVADFHAGMARLAQFCVEEVKQYRTDGYRVVFNLVGGFKTMVAYASLFGMLYADEQIYLFEGEGSPLLRFPQVPLRLDSAGVLLEHTTTLRRLALELPVEAAEIEKLPGGFVERVGDETILSALGTMVWDAERKQLYESKLLPSPDERVVLTPAFVKEAAALGASRLSQLNQRVDELAVFQEGAGTMGQKNPRNLNFKALVTRQHESSWEARAWSDEDAMRLFLERVDGRLEVRHLGKHL